MTKQEVLDALESLKDLTNHTGKQSIDGIKAGITMNLLDRDAAIVPSEPEVKPEEEPQEKPFVSGGRFAEKEPEGGNNDQEEQEAEEGQKLEEHKTKTKVKSVPHGTKKKK